MKSTWAGLTNRRDGWIDAWAEVEKPISHEKNPISVLTNGWAEVENGRSMFPTQ